MSRTEKQVQIHLHYMNNIQFMLLQRQGVLLSFTFRSIYMNLFSRHTNKKAG